MNKHIVGQIATILVASYILTTVVYTTSDLPTPLKDSLDDTQRKLMQESTEYRMEFVKRVFLTSVLNMTCVWMLLH